MNKEIKAESVMVGFVPSDLEDNALLTIGKMLPNGTATIIGTLSGEQAIDIWYVLTHPDK